MTLWYAIPRMNYVVTVSLGRALFAALLCRYNRIQTFFFGLGVQKMCIVVLVNTEFDVWFNMKKKKNNKQLI